MKARLLLFLFSGHGFFDMAAYENYLTGNIVDSAFPEEEIKNIASHLPKLE